MGQSAGGLGKVLGDVGKIAGGFLAANVIGGGVQKLTGFMGDSIAAAKESIQVNAQLEAVLKSTGGAAGKTAQEIKDYAAAWEKQSLFEDEAILKGQNLLLTFTNIQDGVEDGTQIFSKATDTMLDMAQALGTDASGAAIQLGKALNDPTKGITALTRVGVTFTDEQKKQIKAMQEAGNMAGAQMVILDELKKEFGGSAKAASDAAGASEKYKDRMNDLKETIGAKLLPLQLKWQELQAVVIGFIADKVLPTLENFAKYIRFVVSDGDLMNDWLANMPKPLRGIALEMGKVALFIKDTLIPAFSDVVAFIKGHWPEISAVFQFVFDFVKAKIEGMIQIITGIVAVISGVIDLVSDLFHGRWREAWEDLKQIATGILDVLLGTIKSMFGSIPGIIVGLAGDAANAARNLGESIANGIRDTIRSGINFVIRQINTFLNFLSGIRINIPSVDIPLVGRVGGGSVGMPRLPNIPELALGTPFVPRDMLALLHRGEAVVPVGQNKGGGGGVSVNFNGPVTISATDRADAERGAGDMAWGLGLALRARGLAI